MGNEKSRGAPKRQAKKPKASVAAKALKKQQAREAANSQAPPA